MIKKSASFISLVLLFIFLLAAKANASIGLPARFVRVDAPTSHLMPWQEIEVMSGGKNLVLKQPGLFSGTFKQVMKPLPPAEAYTDGNKDPKVRGRTVEFGEKEDEVGAWFEIDLGRPVPIDEIILYGSRYPYREYQDPGHRALSLLDENRRVVWGASLNYYDQKTFPEGIFRFPVTKNGTGAPIVGALTKEGKSMPMPIEWLERIPEENPPADAVARMKWFEARNTKKELKKLADEFFNLLEPQTPGLEEARELYAKGKYQKALDSWKRYWFTKMARVNNHMGYRVGQTVYQGQGDDLLKGNSVLLYDGYVRARKITPGRIKWVDLPENPDGKTISREAHLLLVGKFPEALLMQYNETGDAKYLQRWAEIMDDWSMNSFQDADASKYNVKNLFVMHPGDRWGLLMEDLSSIAVKHPLMVDQIPATTLARMQLACLKQYTPAYWRVARETVFNHNSSGLFRWTCTVPYIDEFRPGTRLARECRRHFERWMTSGNLPDGSMLEIGDEGHFYIQLVLGGVLNLVSQQNPEWLTPGWRNRFLDFYDNTIKYMFRHPMPGGYDHRWEYRLRPERFYGNATALAARDGARPDLQLDRITPIRETPEVRRIIDTVFSVSDGLPEVDPKAPALDKQRLTEKKKNRDEAIKVLGTEKPGHPKIYSDWMPYTGSYYFRSGWKEGDAFLAMLARGSKNGGHADLPSLSYGLVYGFDYNHPLFRAETPTINGIRQNNMGDSHPGFLPGSKTNNICYAEREPMQNRWHTSGRFDFGEATYDGIYQKIDLVPSKLAFDQVFNTPVTQPVFGKKIDNVRSNRQVFQIRGSRLFVFADTIRFVNATPVENAFAIPLTLMLSTLKEGASAPFSKDQAVLDAPGKMVFTKNPDGANVALRQFGDFALDYKSGRTSEPNFREHIWALPKAGIAKSELTSNWKATGDCALATLVSTSPVGGAENIASVKPLNAGPSVAGFEAVMKDGATVWFQCAAGTAELACGPVQVKGSTLLVEKRADGSLSGLALDASAVSVSGKTLGKHPTDFEFVVEAQGVVATTEIYRPVKTVHFHPDINTFLDSQEVKMTCETTGVEIRYTTDGTQPTPESTLYTGPITIKDTTELAARAYRLGADGKPLAADPFEINGTKFTQTSYGWFTKKPLQAPASVDKSSLQPGLLCEHLNGSWTDLYSTAHWMPAVKTTTAEREMDLSQVKREDTYYGARFKGFLEIPSDGVYTFRAPNEVVYPESAASYDLRLYIDGKEWDPTEWWHGRGTWSVPLAKGFHTFQVDFADARTTPWKNSGLWRNYPHPWSVYQGEPSPILVSGPGLSEERIPKDWFFHKAAVKSP